MGDSKAAHSFKNHWSTDFGFEISAPEIFLYFQKEPIWEYFKT